MTNKIHFGHNYGCASLPVFCSHLPDSVLLGDLVEVVMRVALVLKIDGCIDQRVEVVWLSLFQYLGRIKAVAQVVFAALPNVLFNAV